MIDCVIAKNMNPGSEAGAGVYCQDGDVTLLGCRITENQSGKGGGVALFGGSATITNCTIAANSAPSGHGYGGGIICANASSVSMTNCIVWGNSALNQGPQIATGMPGWGAGATSLSVAYSDVENGEAAVYILPGSTLNWGAGNISDDPLFVDPDGPDDDPSTWSDNDYHLAPGSPCGDAGDNAAVLPGTTTDLDGNVRFVDIPSTPDTGNGTAPIVDMGAYEATGPTLVHIADGLGLDPAAFISPKSKHVGFESVDILVNQAVSLIGPASWCVTSTGGSPPDVIAMTPLAGDGLYRVDLSGPIEVAEWTTVIVTVENSFGIEGDLCFQIAHLPGDCGEDAQVSLADATTFRQLFPNGAVMLGDLNGDGQINLNDATKFGQILRGVSGEGKNPDGTGGWNGSGLPVRPACACP